MFQVFAKYFVLSWLLLNLIALPVAAVYSEDLGVFSRDIKKENINIGLFGKVNPINNTHINNKMSEMRSISEHAQKSSIFDKLMF